MDISQLQYFLVVAKEEHITKASEILNLSQSALSRSINSLEREIGLSLFDREKRSIKLNKYGKVFLKDAQRVVKQIEETQDNLEKLSRGKSLDTISINFIHSLGLSYIPKLLGDFKETGVDCNISLNESKADVATNNLLNRKTDFVFGTEYDLFSDLIYIPLFSEKIMLIASDQHRFSNMDIISLEELSKENFIHYNMHTSLRRLIDTTFIEKNMDLNILYEGLEVNSIIGLVAANMGVALVPESCVKNISNINEIRINELNLNRTIYFIYNREKTFSNADKAFKEFTLKYHRRISNQILI